LRFAAPYQYSCITAISDSTETDRKLKLIVDKALFAAGGVAAAATMSPPEATQSKRTQEIQGRNRVAR